MNRSRLDLASGLVLDARRAVWLAEERVLAIGDMHLGYAWAQRAGGNLLPLGAADDTAPRLLALLEDYSPREVAILGDIVHRALPLPAIKEELCRLVDAVGSRVKLTLIIGNHDRDLSRLLHECGIAAGLAREISRGPHRLLHGDGSEDERARDHLTAAATAGGRVIIGHEHPAISLGDGVGTSAKCPCFLEAANLIVLPAFSRWAAGTNFGSHPLLSAYSRAVRFKRVIAILNDKLLPVPL